MDKIIRSNQNLICSECGLKATPKETLEDKIRMYEVDRNKMILCECCFDEYKERWEEFD